VFPVLYSSKKLNLALASAKLNPSIATYNLPLSVEAYDQLLELQEIMHGFTSAASDDIWTYICGRAEHSSSRAYRQLTGSRQVYPSSSGFGNHAHKRKVFFRHLVHDSLSTKNILRRKNMHI